MLLQRIQSEWSVFVEAAVAARASDSAKRDVVRRHRQAHPEEEVADALRHRQLTADASIDRVRQELAALRTRSQALARAYNYVEDDWRYYCRQIHTDPALFRQYFASHETTPQSMGAYSTRVFANATLRNLLSNPFWCAIRHRCPEPPFLAQLSRAMCHRSASTAAAATSAAIFNKRRFEEMSAERESAEQAEAADRHHDAQDEAMAMEHGGEYLRQRLAEMRLQLEERRAAAFHQWRTRMTVEREAQLAALDRTEKAVDLPRMERMNEGALKAVRFVAHESGLEADVDAYRNDRVRAATAWKEALLHEIDTLQLADAKRALRSICENPPPPSDDALSANAQLEVRREATATYLRSVRQRIRDVARNLLGCAKAALSTTSATSMPTLNAMLVDLVHVTDADRVAFDADDNNDDDDRLRPMETAVALRAELERAAAVDLFAYQSAVLQFVGRSTAANFAVTHKSLRDGIEASNQPIAIDHGLRLRQHRAQVVRDLNRELIQVAPPPINGTAADVFNGYLEWLRRHLRPELARLRRDIRSPPPPEVDVAALFVDWYVDHEAWRLYRPMLQRDVARQQALLSQLPSELLATEARMWLTTTTIVGRGTPKFAAVVACFLAVERTQLLLDYYLPPHHQNVSARVELLPAAYAADDHDERSKRARIVPEASMPRMEQ